MKEIKAGKMPQKLEEALCDAFEMISLSAEQIAEMTYAEGFKQGYKKADKLNKK